MWEQGERTVWAAAVTPTLHVELFAFLFGLQIPAQRLDRRRGSRCQAAVPPTQVVVEPRVPNLQALQPPQRPNVTAPAHVKSPPKPPPAARYRVPCARHAARCRRQPPCPPATRARPQCIGGGGTTRAPSCAVSHRAGNTVSDAGTRHSGDPALLSSITSRRAKQLLGVLDSSWHQVSAE